LIVIPAKAGIQHSAQIEIELDPGFRRDDERIASLTAYERPAD
jgi:hypothetical protein